MAYSKYYNGSKNVELGKDDLTQITPESIGASPDRHNHIKDDITDLSLIATQISIADIGANFTATEVEGALTELFTNVSNGKTLIATAITDKGIETNGSDTFATMATNIDNIQVGTPDLHGTLSFTGTYNSTVYVQPQGSSMGSNFETKEVFIIVQGGTSASYGNIVFELVTAPSGITLASSIALYTHASAPANQHFGCVLRGVNQKINVSVNMSARDTTYDWAKASLTVTYA